MSRFELLVDAPFVVSESAFVNPRCHGFRLPSAEEGKMYFSKPIRVPGARAPGTAWL